MNTQSKQLRRKYDAVKFQLVTTELDLAITFFWIADATNDQSKAHRANASAERAYTSAVRLMDGNLNAAQNLEIKGKLTRLNSMMAGCDLHTPFVSQ